MKKYIFLLSFLLIGLLKIQAQEKPLISMDSLLFRVETNYPSILKYEQNTQAWKAMAEGSRAWMPPTFSTGVMRFPYNLMMLNEKNDPMNQAGIPISLEQMIPNPTKLNAKQDYFNSLSEIEKNRSEWIKNELRKEAKILYFHRYINEKKQTVVEESNELLSVLLETAEAKFSSNQSQLQTIYKAKARLAELKNMQLMFNGQIAESNIGLNTLMAKETSTDFEIDTLIEPRNYTVLLTDTSYLARSDINAMSNSIKSMELEQQLLKVSTKPDFGIRAEHMQMFGMPNQWSIMGMITIPIAPWSSKMFSSESKAIGFQIESMELEIQTMELMSKRMQLEKIAMLNFEYEQYDNYKKEIIPAFENNLQANLLAYKQNTGDFFVLLDAWEMLLMKKMEMYDKLFTILKLEADYEYEKEIK